MPEHTPAEHGLLTIAEIARHYSLPESTARFYCKRFMDYLPHVGEGKRKRYRSEVIDVFAVILAEIKKRKNAGAVEAVLAERFPRNIEPGGLAQPQPQDNSIAVRATSFPAPDWAPLAAIVQGQGQALGQIADALTRLVDREDAVRELREQLAARDRALAERDKALEGMRQEMQVIRRLQDDAESMHQQDVETLRKWLSQLAQQLATK
ncbi:MAG: hypothetical protein AB7E47_04790 [Desulfovibrionaceae bacterium]